MAPEVHNPDIIEATPETTVGEQRRLSEGADLAPVQVPEQSNEMSVITALARDERVSLDKLKALIEMQHVEQDRAAEREFYAAMARAGGEVEAVHANAYNDQTSSQYAKLNVVASAIIPALSRQNLNIRFTEVPTDSKDSVRLEYTLSHALGHVERGYREYPFDGVGIKGNTNKTAIHAKQSAVSYAQRHTLLGLFNLSVFDDDGNSAMQKSDRISDKDAEILKGILIECGDAMVGRVDKFYAQYGATSAEDLKKEHLIAAMKCARGVRDKAKKG